jgi:hypothetical protein
MNDVFMQCMKSALEIIQGFWNVTFRHMFLYICNHIWVWILIRLFCLIALRSVAAVFHFGSLLSKRAHAGGTQEMTRFISLP